MQACLLLKQSCMTSKLKMRAAFTGSAIVFFVFSNTLRGQTRDITVPDTGEVKADFTLGVVNLLKY
jgi:hypothetical protein